MNLKDFIFKKNKKKTIFDKHNMLTVLSVYSDKATIFLVERRSSGREGYKYVISNFNIDRYVFLKDDLNNIELSFLKNLFLRFKANLPKGVDFSSNIVLALSPEFSKSTIVDASLSRKSDSGVITDSEFDAFLDSTLGACQDKNIFFKSIESIKLDGYKVKSAIGAFASSLDVDLLCFSLSDAFKACVDKMKSDLNLEFVKIIDLNYSILKKESKMEDSFFINIFEESAVLSVVRGGSVTSMSVVGGGHKEFERIISKGMRLGLREAEDLSYKFIKSKLDIRVFEIVRSLAIDFSKNVLARIKKAIISLDEDIILPEKIKIAFSSDVPIQLEQVFNRGSGWFSDLPFPQDVEISFLNKRFDRDIDKDEKIKKSYKLCIYSVIDDIINS